MEHQFPVAHRNPHATGAATPLPPASQRERNAPRGGTGRVAVVEPDAAIRGWLADALGDAGYVVDVHPNGAAALAAFAAASSPPDAVLLNVRASSLAGHPLDAWYRRQPGATPPLILLSAGDRDELASAASTNAVAAVISLPCDLDDLLTAVAGVAASRWRAPSPEPAPRPSYPRHVPKPLQNVAAERRRRLERLRDDTGRLRNALTTVRARTGELAATEASRRLTAEERREVSAVRREAEALRLELTALRQEFAQLRAPFGEAD